MIINTDDHNHHYIIVLLQRYNKIDAIRILTARCNVCGRRVPEPTIAFQISCGHTKMIFLTLS